MKKNLLSEMNWPQTILVILLIISSFFVGSLYTKVRYLEGSDKTKPDTAAAPKEETAKYKTFNDAMADLAKGLKMDDKKLVSCIDSGEKAEIVNKDKTLAQQLGATGTPAYFINGRFLGGAFPIDSFKEIIDKELSGKASDNPKNYSEFLQSAASRNSFDPVPKKISIGDSSTRGAKKPKVTIVEFSDFQCPYCEKGFITINQLMKDYQDSVQLVFKNLPLSAIHPHAEKAAEAAQCAKDQGKFWEFHDRLFETQAEWSSI